MEGDRQAAGNGPPDAAGAGIRLPPIGFWSYSRQDDELSKGKLSMLRSLLMAELQQLHGRVQVQLFQDVSTIRHGADWERETRASLGRSTFLIPIITPNFIQSEWCALEMRIFFERERQLRDTYAGLPSRSLIFPIHLIDVERTDPHDDAVLRELKTRQWFDFRGFRHKNYQDESVLRSLSEFAGNISDLLHIRVTQGRAPETDESVPADVQVDRVVASVRAAPDSFKADIARTENPRHAPASAASAAPPATPPAAPDQPQFSAPRPEGDGSWQKIKGFPIFRLIIFTYLGGVLLNLIYQIVSGRSGPVPGAVSMVTLSASFVCTLVWALNRRD